MTQTGPVSVVATSRCSGSSAARTSARLLDTAPILAVRADVRAAAAAPVDRPVTSVAWLTAGGGTLVEGSVLSLSSPYVPTGASMSFTMYSTAWCGYCRRLKRVLERDGITFDEVDIDSDPAAAELVRSVNGGNATVPTLVFADGSALTNPTADEVRARLPGS
jgi:mycoredoxin